MQSECESIASSFETHRDATTAKQRAKQHSITMRTKCSQNPSEMQSNCEHSQSKCEPIWVGSLA
eukprot:364747-Amphidinium_carterae.1